MSGEPRAVFDFHAHCLPLAPRMVNQLMMKQLCLIDIKVFAVITSEENDADCERMMVRGAKEPKGCVLTNTQFADFCGTNNSEISRSLRRLRDSGYVKQISYDGRKRILEALHGF